MARDRQRAKQRKAKRQKQQQSQPARPTGGDKDQPAKQDQIAQSSADAVAGEPKVAPEPKQAPQPREAQAGETKSKAVTQERRRGKVSTFLGEVRAELKRVQWPDRQTLAQGTAVVVGAVAIAGLYLGLWDFIWNKLVQAAL